jgi:hypothetical protein
MRRSSMGVNRGARCGVHHVEKVLCQLRATARTHDRARSRTPTPRTSQLTCGNRLIVHIIELAVSEGTRRAITDGVGSGRDPRWSHCRGTGCVLALCWECRGTTFAHRLSHDGCTRSAGPQLMPPRQYSPPVAETVRFHSSAGLLITSGSGEYLDAPKRLRGSVRSRGRHAGVRTAGRKSPHRGVLSLRRPQRRAAGRATGGVELPVRSLYGRGVCPVPDDRHGKARAPTGRHHSL